MRRCPAKGSCGSTLTPTQPYVLNGPHGIVQEGAGRHLGLLLRSSPRRAGARWCSTAARARVRGQGWFDHQWGNFVTNSASWHWNWFACQFKDGSDLMLYQFITPTGQPTGVQSGTFVSSAWRASGIRDGSPSGRWDP